MKLKYFAVMLPFFLSTTIVFAGNSLCSNKPQLTISSLVELYRNIDKEKLKSKDEKLVISYLTEKNTEIKEYLVKTYPEEGFEAIDVNEASTFVIGLMTAMAEDNKFQPLKGESAIGSNDQTLGLHKYSNQSLPGWVACSLEVITGVFDIVGLYQEYVQLFSSSSVSWGSVASIVGKTLKRHFGWFAAAYLVYDIATTCF